jgi:hypothetical protein
MKRIAARKPLIAMIRNSAATVVLAGFHLHSAAWASTTVVSLGPATVAQITPSLVIPPGSTFNQPSLAIHGDATEDPFPSRIVIEFAITGIGGPADVVSAVFGATSFGGSINGAARLKFSLFGYAGNGVVNLDTGIDPDTGASGQLLAGPFSYNSVGGAYPNLQNIDVTSFIKSLVEAGATHAGFMFRDVETADGARTINHLIVVQNTTRYPGLTPPSLALTLIPEPSTAVLSIGAAALLLRRRRHGQVMPLAAKPG